MPFFVFAIQNPKLNTYSIKVHQDSPDFNTTGRTIINKFKNMEHYKKTKDDNYKLYNNADTKQELIFTQFGTSKKLNTPISIKKMIYNIIDKIKDGSIVNFLEKLNENKSNINMEYIKAVKALIRLKCYTLLRNVAKTKEEIADKQQTIRDEKKGITDIQKDRVEKIIQKLLNDKEKPRMITNIMIELIKEDEKNRIIMNRMLDSKQMKSIRNKLARMKKVESLETKTPPTKEVKTPTKEVKNTIIKIKKKVKTPTKEVKTPTKEVKNTIITKLKSLESIPKEKSVPRYRFDTYDLDNEKFRKIYYTDIQGIIKKYKVIKRTESTATLQHNDEKPKRYIVYEKDIKRKNAEALKKGYGKHDPFLNNDEYIILDKKLNTILSASDVWNKNIVSKTNKNDAIIIKKKVANVSTEFKLNQIYYNHVQGKLIKYKILKLGNTFLTFQRNDDKPKRTKIFEHEHDDSEYFDDKEINVTVRAKDVWNKNIPEYVKTSMEELMEKIEKNKL